MLQGQNISVDCLYMSIALANWLFSRIITWEGRLNHNHQDIPAEFKDSSILEEFSKHTHMSQ